MLSIQKISILIVFFAIFLIQTVISGPEDISKWINFDVMTVIVVGMMFGPLEGILYGFLADTIGWLIGGGSWNAYYAFQYPIAGAIAGSFSYLYTYLKNKVNKITSFSIFQIATISIITLSVVLPITLYPIFKPNDSLPIWQVLTTVFLSFGLFEALQIYLFKKNKDEMFLATILFFVFVLERTINGIIIKPLGDTYIGWSSWESYPSRVLLQLFKTSYLEVINTLLAFSLIKVTSLAIEQFSTKKNFGINI